MLLGTYPLRKDCVLNILFLNIYAPTIFLIDIKAFIVAIDAIKIPTSIQEAMRSEHWTQAMREEMEAIERNSTWEIVDKPRDKKTVRCKWIFKVKHKANVSIDYEETFSPVAMMNTVRVVLALA